MTKTIFEIVEIANITKTKTKIKIKIKIVLKTIKIKTKIAIATKNVIVIKNVIIIATNFAKIANINQIRQLLNLIKKTLSIRKFKKYMTNVLKKNFVSFTTIKIIE